MQFRVAAFLLAFTVTPGSATPPSATSAPTAPAASNKAAPTTPAAPAAPNAPAAPARDYAVGGGTGNAAAAAGQARQNFTIINNTGHIVTMLNVSSHSERNWGPDVLHGEKLGNGESAEITFDRGETECTWDIKATYDDGQTTDMREVNLCEVAAVTLTPN